MWWPLLAEFFLVSSLSLLFVWQIENWGFLFRKLLFSITQQIDQKVTELDDFSLTNISSFLINIFLGLLVFGMSFFYLGVLRVLSKELVIGVTSVSAILIFLFFKRWQNFTWVRLQSFVIDNKFILVGLFLVLVLVLPFAFRPITNFDALWYHLTIPKFFLQEGNIDYLGTHTRYSVHPYLNFFWNLWPLSLPLPIPIQGMVINLFQVFIVLFGLLFVLQIAKSKLFSWPPILQVLAPGIIALFPASLIWFGAGYNDLYGLILGLVLALYAYKLAQQDRINLYEFVVFMCLLITVFLVKVFFAIFAGLVFIFFVVTCLHKFTFIQLKNFFVWDFWSWNNLKVLLICCFLLFLIFIVPWLVRSVIFTGRLLDPIGAPGIAEDAYRFAGSNDAFNHWTKFVWARLVKSLSEIFIYQYGLWFIVGSLAFLQKSFWTKYKFLWLLGTIGFWSVYFFSIVTEWRYFLPSAALVVFLGLVNINLVNHLPKKVIMAGLVLVFSFHVGFTYYASYYTDNRHRDLYILKKQTYDEFLTQRNGQWMFDYYPGAKAVLPSDLNKSEKIFVFGVHNLAYIENPIITYDSHSRLFLDVKTFSDFIKVLKTEKIRFMLLKRTTVYDLCMQLMAVKQLSDQDCLPEIEFTNDLTVVAIDKPQQAIWVKIV